MATPAEMAHAVEDAMVHKATNPPIRSLLLSFSGGAYISLGYVFYITTQVGAEAMPWGVSHLIGGMVFSVGLMLVVLTGADLFTSTTMTLMAKASGAISWGRLLRHWGLVYLGNAIGALTVLAVVYLGGVYEKAGGAWGMVVLETAESKLNHTFLEAFVLGIGCNLLVCLAVWAAFSGRSTTDKILAVIGPVALFVAVGFEHSVANMFLIPLGMVIRGEIAPDAFADLTLGNFLGGNLLPVTLGNIVGGGMMIGLYYWVIFRRPSAADTGDALEEYDGAR